MPTPDQRPGAGRDIEGARRNTSIIEAPALAVLNSSETLNKLPHISEVKPFGEHEKDAAFLEGFTALVVSLGMENRVGFSLLHEHFPVASNEVMVETTDEESRMQSIKPVKNSELPEGKIIETNFSISNGTLATNLVCRLICIEDQNTNKHTGAKYHIETPPGI